MQPAANIREYVEGTVGKQLVWGVSDCAMWAAQWWEIATGEPLDLPPYSTEAEAQEKIEDAGGLTALIASQIGEPDDMFAVPMAGDVCVVQMKNNDVTALGIGGGCVAFRTQLGVRPFNPREHFIKAIWTP